MTGEGDIWRKQANLQQRVKEEHRLIYIHKGGWTNETQMYTEKEWKDRQRQEGQSKTGHTKTLSTKKKHRKQLTKNPNHDKLFS